MQGWIVDRVVKAGEKRYDASWRANWKIKTKTFPRKKDALTQDLYAHVFSRVRVEAMRRLGQAMASSRNPAEQAGTSGNTV
jgi:hypothetical protein